MCQNASCAARRGVLESASMSIYDPTPGQQVFGPWLPSYDELQGCIRCGRCLPVCPTYGETQLEMYSPRGRLSLLRAVEDGKLELTRGVEAHLYHCLDCRGVQHRLSAGRADR